MVLSLSVLPKKNPTKERSSSILATNTRSAEDDRRRQPELCGLRLTRPEERSRPSGSGRGSSVSTAEAGGAGSNEPLRRAIRDSSVLSASAVAEKRAERAVGAAVVIGELTASAASSSAVMVPSSWALGWGGGTGRRACTRSTCLGRRRRCDRPPPSSSAVDGLHESAALWGSLSVRLRSRDWRVGDATASWLPAAALTMASAASWGQVGVGLTGSVGGAYTAFLVWFPAPRITPLT